MYSPRLSKAATTFRSESSSTGRTTCLESDRVSRTGADFMGHTSTLSLEHKPKKTNISWIYWSEIKIQAARWCQLPHMSLGWHCSFRMGEGKRNLWSQSPVRTSHCDTMLSVEALTSLWPSRLQLRTHKQVTFFNPSSSSWLWCRTQMFTLKVAQAVKQTGKEIYSVWTENFWKPHGNKNLTALCVTV